MRILSLFDGMACGMIAMLNAGIEVESYDAYEIDKYAVRTATHNFPMIREHGDVFKADFTEYEGVDFLIGGSPCTYWSIAQTKNRETVASGMGWELFSQYVRALHEAKPKYFIYENNKSMSKEIRASINDAFGFEAVLINSALVSAQNRQRLYWVGKRNVDGTYNKVDVQQPEDRGIFLRDILETGCAMRDKGRTVIGSCGSTTCREYFQSHQSNMAAAEPVNTTDEGKSQTIKAQYHNNSIDNFCVYNSTYGATGVAEPVCVASRGRNPDNLSDRTAGIPTQQHLEAHTDGKTNTLTSVIKDNLVAEPITDICQVGSMPMPNGEPSTSAGFRVYSPDAKGRYLCANGGGAGAKTGLYALPCDSQCYAVPCEWGENGEPTKAVSCADGKIYTVYKVENGRITIKDKQYPIKLVDGFYIIRKLTVRECKRLQTVPDWYEFPVSNTQAYKMLGNGWTCDVITHLIREVLK